MLTGLQWKGHSPLQRRNMASDWSPTVWMNQREVPFLFQLLQGMWIKHADPYHFFKVQTA